MAESKRGAAAGPQPVSPWMEPTAEIAARVHRRLAIMGLLVIGVPLAYLIGWLVARSQPMTVERCLPPGVTLSTRVVAGVEGESTVGGVLERMGARVVNGTLLDAEGLGIRFATEGSGGAAEGGKEGVKKAYRVITIPHFAAGSGT